MLPLAVRFPSNYILRALCTSLCISADSEKHTTLHHLSTNSKHYKQ
jgi:hypothetical protein